MFWEVSGGNVAVQHIDTHLVLLFSFQVLLLLSSLLILPEVRASVNGRFLRQKHLDMKLT